MRYSKNYKTYRRGYRLWRLIILTNALYNFHLMKMNETIIKKEQDYKDCEKFSNTINSIFQKTTTAQTFYKKDDEVLTEIVKYHNEFVEWVNAGQHLGLDEKIIVAFCKYCNYNMHLMSYYGCIGWMYYGNYYGALLNYNDDIITKEQLLSTLVEYSVWGNGASKPIKYSIFRKETIKLETLFNDIVYKQYIRQHKNGY